MKWKKGGHHYRSTDLNMIINEHCEQIYAHKFDNLKWINSLMKQTPERIQKEINKLDNTESIK